MKRIDAEIAAVEERIGAHKVALAYAADAAKQRAASKLRSPAVVGAAALVGGLLVLKMVRGHRRRAAEVPQRRSMDREQAKKGFALGTLLMTGATWLIRSQFGGPVGLAQFVLSKVREGRLPATVEPADTPPRLPR